MKTLTLNNSFSAFFEPEDENRIDKISKIVYGDTNNQVLRLKKNILNKLDEVANQINNLIYKKSTTTIFWLSDNYDQNIIYSRNKRVYRDISLMNLVKDGKYLESISKLKPQYLILNVTGADFLMPERIVHMIEQLSNGELEQTDVFDIVTIVLKKSLQKLYYSIHMLSPETMIICQELKHPKRWVDHLIKNGIVEEEDRKNAIKKLSKAFCNVLKSTAAKYEYFNYEGCK